MAKAVLAGSKSWSSRSVAMAVSFVGMAAPIAAFVAITRRQARRVCTAEHSDSGRSEAEDGGLAAFLSREECREIAAGEESRRAAVADPPRLPSDRPLEGRSAPFPGEGHHAHAGPRAVYDMKRARSSGASRSRNAA